MNKEELEAAIADKESEIARSEDCLSRVHGSNRWYGRYVDNIRLMKVDLQALKDELASLAEI